jgi:membrane protein YqaA with SNARE-associated domain
MIDFDIGKIIYEFFSVMGIPGLLFCIFLLFYLDAILIPTLPELFTVIIFMANPEPWFAALILATIAVAEFLGLTTLYLIVKGVRVPGKIEAAVHKYKDFLLVRDERMIIVNRFAPVLPFMGAFVAICGWSYRKAVLYTIASGLIKYGAILALSNLFFVYFSKKTAGTVTIAMVLMILMVSLVVSIYRKRKMGSRTVEEVCPIPSTNPEDDES